MSRFGPEALRRRLAALPAASVYWVAYSGGRDSHALLHALVALRDSLKPARIRAIHIDHGLQVPSAGWARHCRRVCQQLQVPCVSERVQVQPRPGEGLEAAARRARYAVFEQVVSEGEAVLTAHHLDDQAETLLLRLFRGSGVDGLAAMPPYRRLGRGLLLRPLLDFSRDELTAYATVHGLQWVDDPTNEEIDADRNFVRNGVLPLIRQRWPSIAQVLARNAAQLRDTAQLIDSIAAQDWEQVAAQGRPNLESLAQLPPSRQRNLIRRWIRRAGLLPPPQARLEQGLAALLTAREDRAPVLEWGGGVIRRYRGELYLTGPLPPPPATEWHWDLREDLVMPQVGTLRARPVSERGLRVPPAGVRVRLRQGGERYTPAGGRHSRSVKNLLQEKGVPPWLRDRLPLLFVGDEVAAVADLCVCEGFQSAPGEQGVRIQWLPYEGDLRSTEQDGQPQSGRQGAR